MKQLVIKGTGSTLASRLVSNEELARKMETSNEWIVSRSGIRQRYFCDEGETTATLAIEAARAALGNAGVSADELDLILVATSTPDHTLPGVAMQVQGELHSRDCIAFDLQAACSGFVYGLSVADSFAKTGKAKMVLLIGADSYSHILNMNDRSTAVLFGDGAGAVVLQAEEVDEEIENPAGVLGVEIFSDGRYTDLLRTTGGAGSTGDAGKVSMQGREVFRHAVRAMGDIVPYMLEKYGLQAEDISWLVPHQANLRIIEATAKMLELPMEKVVVTVDRHANTSSASIALALDDAARAGRFRPGDLLFVEAFGAGFTWGAALVRW